MPTQSTVGAALLLDFPVLLVIYAGFWLFLRPPRQVLLASLLGGIVMSLITLIVDLIAYDAHWWYYTLKDLVWHLPLPLYIFPALTFGSMAFLWIWHYWPKPTRWHAWLALTIVPFFCIIRDIFGGMTHTAFQQWENVPAAIVATILMWLVAFFTGFWIFWSLTIRKYIHKEKLQAQ